MVYFYFFVLLFSHQTPRKHCIAQGYRLPNLPVHFKPTRLLDRKNPNTRLSDGYLPNASLRSPTWKGAFKLKGCPRETVLSVFPALATEEVTAADNSELGLLSPAFPLPPYRPLPRQRSPTCCSRNEHPGRGNARRAPS